MLRVIGFLIVGVVVIAADWWLGNLTGRVSADIGSFHIDTSAAMAIFVLVVVFFLLYLLLRLLGVIFRAPGTGSAWRHRHRVRVGERAITRVLVALAAGEDRAARREAKRARALLGDSPQTLLLCAEAGRMGGREDEAEEAFQALTKQEDGKFLGYRGLLRQAVDRHDWAKADAIAKEAEAARPGTAWLRQQRAELAIQTDSWAQAAELSDPAGPKAAYYVAAADAETDKNRALGYAKLALKADPTFVPAVLAYARRQSDTGSEKRAQAAIAEAWKREPHQDLADYALSKGATPGERYQLARKLVASNPTHPESRLLLAKAAINAGMIAEARQQIEAVRADGLNQRRMWLLIAEIDEHEKGDTEEGRTAQRDALRRASSADPDPAWHCSNCRTDTSAWAARCPSCNSVGTLKWQAAAVSPAIPALV